MNHTHDKFLIAFGVVYLLAFLVLVWRGRRA
jgi:hypothetical protein